MVRESSDAYSGRLYGGLLMDRTAIETIHRAALPALRAESDAYDRCITAGGLSGDLRFLMLSHGETRS